MQMTSTLIRVGWMPLLDGAIFSSTPAIGTTPDTVQAPPRRTAMRLPRRARLNLRARLSPHDPHFTQLALISENRVESSDQHLTPGLTRRVFYAGSGKSCMRGTLIRGRLHAVVRRGPAFDQEPPTRLPYLADEMDELDH